MIDYKRHILYLLATLFIFYCGSYRAYFNTYYNAEQLYKAGINGSEEEAEKDKSKISHQAFNSAIRKFSKVLELYSDSKYVDDSLFYLGKIFYFQEKYVDAEVKFSEIISSFPKSNLIAKSHFWRAKSFTAQGNFTGAENDYRRVLDLDDGNLKNEALIGLADILFYQRNYKEAVQRYQSIVTRVKDDNIRSESQFQIGECYLLMGDYENAVIGYDKVKNFNPDNYYRFASKYGVARALKFQEKYDEAIKVLEELLKDGKNKDYFSLIELEIAKCLEAKGDYQKAKTAYSNLIKYYKKGEEVARSYYNLGKINFQIYTKLDTSVSLFIYAKNSAKDQNLKDSVEYKISKINDIKKYQEEAKRLYNQRTKLAEKLEKMSDSDTSSAENEEYSKTKKNYENICKEESDTRFALSELYFSTSGWMDSALVHLKTIVEELSTTQNTPYAYYMLSNIYQAKKNDELSNKYFDELIEKFPKSDIVFYIKNVNNELPYNTEIEKSKSIYLSAEKLIFEKSNYKDGIDSLKKIYNEYPKTPYAAKSLYTIGWVYEYYFGDSTRTIEYYNKILEDYPYTRYARQGEKRLNLILLGKSTEREKEAEKEKTSVEEVTPPEKKPEEDIITMPEIISDVKPEYVESEKEKGHKGIVTLKLIINQQGKVISARVIENTTGSKILGESAEKAAKECLFIPAKRGNTPILKTIQKKFYFGVEKDEDN